ncbi:hypothetical protein N5079_12395 [Planotetraspora sp. A-T 1434]|uniref:hypothetical protein n=1 Tax=Planotetraspora sp. A-T 1434 TaxID=2979219 RepID=UPI0021BEBE8F|nr:hypothetical protein [Planotetraspora sp. A-T 1434]MCT9931018.1 hypothetical protein [Planotetraspora sp. A-T 1434]
MIQSQANVPSLGAKPAKRMLLAGVVGIILPVSLLAWALLMVTLFPESAQCGEYTGCLGYLVAAWVAGRWVAIAVAWPLLFLLRVRPAWPVAILAALFLMAIWRLADALWAVDIDATLTLILLSGVIAYPFAALVATPRLPRPWRALPVVLFGALYLLATLLPGFPD